MPSIAASADARPILKSLVFCIADTPFSDVKHVDRKRATNNGSGTRNFGARKVWEKDTILIYPDGRAGKEISVPFTMTVAAGMKEWRDQAVIQIRVSDDEVVVSGSAIEVGSGEPELRFKRFDE